MVEKTHGLGLWPALYEPFRSMSTRLADWLSPASEASSDKEAYRISMEVPGVHEDDIDVSVHGDVLTIKGEKRTEKEDKGDTWFFSERQYGAFSRNFRLPADADADGVTADLKDGVLAVVIPKATPEVSEAKTVKISRG